MAKKRALKAVKRGKKKAARKSTRAKGLTPIDKIEALISEFGSLDDDEYRDALAEMEQRAGDALNTLKEEDDD